MRDKNVNREKLRRRYIRKEDNEFDKTFIITAINDIFYERSLRSPNRPVNYDDIERIRNFLDNIKHVEGYELILLNIIEEKSNSDWIRDIDIDTVAQLRKVTPHTNLAKLKDKNNLQKYVA